MKDGHSKKKQVPLTEAPNHLPKRRGKKVHYSTIYRWATKGARGRVLESVIIGGIRYTTVEALQRFVDDNPCKENSQSAVQQALSQVGL